MFNFTSWKKNCDETCVIKVGDHPFVTNKTIVEYRRGINLTPIKWQQILENLWYEPKAPVSTELLRRIQQGALAPNSRATQELQEIVKLFLV